jgi:hypothetical protein
MPLLQIFLYLAALLVLCQTKKLKPSVRSVRLAAACDACAEWGELSILSYQMKIYPASQSFLYHAAVLVLCQTEKLKPSVRSTRFAAMHRQSGVPEQVINLILSDADLSGIG